MKKDLPMPNASKLSANTLIPISLAAAVAAGSFYLAAANSKIESNEKMIVKNEIQMQSMKKESNSYYIDIIQRLSRIEEAIKK